MDKNMQQLPEQLQDSAAAEALGANTGADSAAYQHELAASPAARRLDRSLRETVASMAAASPYLEPPADLRGKILQATAPTTFKMEDYRKVNRDGSRFYRWGFYAAMAFLAAGAYFNLSLQNQLKFAGSQQQAMIQQINLQNHAMSNVVNPKAVPVVLQQDNKVFGRAFLNAEDKTAIVLLPGSLLPEGKTIEQLTVAVQDGKPVTYRAITIPTNRDAFPQVAAGDKLNATINVNNVQADPTQQIFTAQMAR